VTGLTFADGHFPYPVKRLAQDNQPFEPWDGETFYSGQISKSSGQMVHTAGQNSYYDIGPLTLEQASFLFWRVTEWEAKLEIDVTAASGPVSVSIAGEVDGTITGKRGYVVADEEFYELMRFYEDRHQDLVQERFLDAPLSHAWGEIDEDVIPPENVISAYLEDNDLEELPDSAGYRSWSVLLSVATAGWVREVETTEGTKRYAGIRFKGPVLGSDGFYWARMESFREELFFAQSTFDTNEPGAEGNVARLRRFSLAPDVEGSGTEENGKTLQMGGASFRLHLPSFLLPGGVPGYLDCPAVAAIISSYLDIWGTPDYSDVVNVAINTPVIIHLTPKKFFTYGGIYDEDSGERV
jgi:hypothetical protein